MTRVVLVADTVYLGDDAGTALTRAAVEITDGTITAVDPLTGPTPSGPDVVDLGDQVLMPGLVNAHTHTPMTLFRGVADRHSLLTLEGWRAVVLPLERQLSAELMPAAVEVTLAEMIASGTTYFADQYFALEAYDAVVRRSGLRAELAYGIIGLSGDETREASLAAAEAFLEQAPADPLVHAWMGPHAFFVDNRLENIEAEMALAISHGIGLHTHFGTSGAEDEVCRERFGMGALAMLDRLGVLDRPLILAHANTVDRAGLGLLAGRPVTLVAAPSVAMMSGAPPTPVRAALDAGVNIALGTDSLSSNSADLFEEMRTLGKVAAHEARRPSVLSPRELLGLATWRGHRALNPRDDTPNGRIVAGAVGDLIALPTSALHRGPTGAHTLEAALVYGASGFTTSTVMVSGRFLKRDGDLLSVDLGEAREKRELDFERLTRSLPVPA